MTVEEAITVFSSYSVEEKEQFLAHLMYELTILARESYEVGRDGLTDPQRVRLLNEVQHRVSAFLWALLRNDSQRYPDDVFVRIILGFPDDSVLGRQLYESFARLANHRVPIA